MKKNFWLFVLLLLSAKIYSQNIFFGNYHYYNQAAELEAGVNYSHNLGYDFSFNYDALLQKAHNDKFNRTSRNNQIDWNLLYTKKDFNFNLRSAYAFLADNGKIDTQSYSNKQNKKSIGLALSYSPSAFFKVNESFTGCFNNLDLKEDVKNNGIENFFGITLGNNRENLLYSFNPYLSYKKLDYENKYIWGGNSNFTYANDFSKISSLLAMSETSEGTYISRMKTDTQIKRKYNADFNIAFPVTENAEIRFDRNYSFEKTRLKSKKDKNYSDKLNGMQLTSQAKVGRFWFRTNLKREFGERKYETDYNRKESDYRMFEGILGYRLTENDTLSFTRKTELTRNDYPSKGNNIDNDQYLNSYQITDQHHFSNFYLLNYFIYNERHEVFLYKQMSANNNLKKSYNAQPNLYYLLPGKGFIIGQSYHLRADYDSFDWKISGPDRLYRKFSAQYFWRYSSLDITYLKEENINRSFYQQAALLIELDYKYDANNSGEKENGVFKSAGKNTSHSIWIDAQKKYDAFIFRLKPRYNWTKSYYEDTYKGDFSHVAEITYNFAEDDFATLLINPSGTSVNDLIWKVNFEVNIAF